MLGCLGSVHLIKLKHDALGAQTASALWVGAIKINCGNCGSVYRTSCDCGLSACVSHFALVTQTHNQKLSDYYNIDAPATAVA